MAASSSRPDSNRTPPPSPSHCAAKETTALGAGYLTGIGAGFLERPRRHRRPVEIRQALRTPDERHAKSLPLRRLAQSRPTRLSLGQRVTLTTFPGKIFAIQSTWDLSTGRPDPSSHSRWPRRASRCIHRFNSGCPGYYLISRLHGLRL